jgi:hypothetical protein
MLSLSCGWCRKVLRLLCTETNHAHGLVRSSEDGVSSRAQRVISRSGRGMGIRPVWDSATELAVRVGRWDSLIAFCVSGHKNIRWRSSTI